MSHEPTPSSTPHQRRPRYTGKYPRRFDQKYKELGGDTETVAKVLASGKTPAGTHRPIMVAEVLEVLAPQPGERAVDCTLGYGGHAQALLGKLLPGGVLLGVDADPFELPKTEARLRERGFGEDELLIKRANFAGLTRILAGIGWEDGADVVFADLGVSSMQLDNPERGFGFKHEGPLDLRLNPKHGAPASAWLAKATPFTVRKALVEGADEPYAEDLSQELAGKNFATTWELSRAVRAVVPSDEADLTLRRVFQALRIVVNDEYSALESLLRELPDCLRSGGRVAVLSFHSGEDRRVKKSFAHGLETGLYSEIAREVIRSANEEVWNNPRSSAAKLRWARKA